MARMRSTVAEILKGVDPQLKTALWDDMDDRLQDWLILNQNRLYVVNLVLKIYIEKRDKVGDTKATGWLLTHGFLV